MQNVPNQSMTYAELKRRVAQGLVVRTNSRHVQPGDAFVAIPGPTVNGASFHSGSRWERGAAYVLIQDDTVVPADLSAQVTSFISHPDPRTALGELAALHFKTDSLPFPVLGNYRDQTAKPPRFFFGRTHF